MRKLAFAAIVLGALSAVAYAKQEGPSPEGGAGFPATDVNEEEAQRRIQNWWDLDYKKKHLPPPFGFALINFGVFAAIMYRLAGKPLKQYMLDRHSRIRKDLDEASALRKQAEAKLDEYSRKVANVEQEIDAIVKSVEREAQVEKERLIKEAQAQAERLKADAQKQIAAEIDRARRELRVGVIEAAVKAAEEILQKQVGADDQKKLAERYVADLEKSASPTGRPA